MMADHRYTYQQIAWEIREKIRKRELKPGSHIPSLPAIREQYGVSYPTAQAAVALLKSWGLVDPQRGVGTLVRESRPVIDEQTTGWEVGTYSWKEVCARSGMTGSQRVTGAGTDPAPADVADAFGYDAGTPVAWRSRLMLADGVAVQIVTSYYATEVAAALPKLAMPARLRAWAVDLMTEAGFGVTRFTDVAIARASSAEEAGALGIDVGSAILDVFRTAWSNGAVVMVELSVVNSARQRQSWSFS